MCHVLIDVLKALDFFMDASYTRTGLEGGDTAPARLGEGGRVPSPRDATGGAFTAVYQSTSTSYQSGRALARDELPVMGRGLENALCC